jgi:ectoine hydroxylase-related dioxygenase (phytanoyl-CoA dioxygenase family)
MPGLGRCRPVTPAETAHYREHGWAKLDGFLDPDSVRRLLALAEGRMGKDGAASPVREGEVGFLSNQWTHGLDDPEFAPLIASIGENGRHLLGRDLGVRYLMDSFVAKLPEGSGRASGSARTDVHQDLSTWPVDRTGGMSFWIALADAGPDSGTMEFYSGSHRMGPLGAFSSHSGRNLTDVYPEIAAHCPSSGHLSYSAGDATVHADLCAHGTGLNLTDHPRWAYIIGCVAADACWNGAQTSFFPCDTLVQYGPLDDAGSPVIG